MGETLGGSTQGVGGGGKRKKKKPKLVQISLPGQKMELRKFPLRTRNQQSAQEWGARKNQNMSKGGNGFLFTAGQKEERVPGIIDRKDPGK